MFVTTPFRADHGAATPNPLAVRLFVADCTTMSAPCWIGRSSAGVATVVVDDQRQVVAVRKVRHRGDVKEPQPRVARQLAIQEPRVLIDLRSPTRRCSVGSVTHRHSMSRSSCSRTLNCWNVPP
jgi:hypothetical protein